MDTIVSFGDTWFFVAAAHARLTLVVMGFVLFSFSELGDPDLDLWEHCKAAGSRL